MKREKIVFICEALGGGVRKHLLDLLENLDLQKYEIHFIYGTNKRVDEIFKREIKKYKDMGMKFYQIKDFQRKIDILKDVKSLFKMFIILKKINPDLVHCHSSKAGAIGRIAAKIAGIKRIYYTPHGYIFLNKNINKIKSNIFILIEKFLAVFSNFTIHVSYGEEQDALNKKILNKTKSKVVYNGIKKVNPFNEINKTKRIIIGTIARMDYQKNPVLFAEIAKETCKKYDDVEFWYIGDGEYYNKINDYIIAEGISDRVKLKGFKANATNYLSYFDIFLSTSFYEGLPYTLIESMSAGVPIVASNVTGNNEIVAEGINGLLFDIDSTNEALDKLELLISNNDIRQNMSSGCLDLFEEKYSLKKMIDNYEEIYDFKKP